jgi:secreted trypsin-like serine protease
MGKPFLRTRPFALLLAPVLLTGVLIAGQPAAQARPGGDVRPQVVGGTEVPDGTYPFQVSLVDEEYGREYDDATNHSCGGTALNRSWILVAWHCVLAGVRPGRLTVVAGRTDLRDQTKGQRRTVAEIQRHPQAWTNPVDGSYQRYARDWALVGLTRPLVLDQPATAASERVEAVNLVAPGDHSYEQEGTPATAIGWGVTENNAPSARLRQGDVPIIADQRCRELLPASVRQYLVDDVMTCAGRPTVAGAPYPGVDACTEDSGGPLLARDAQGRLVQVAVVSWGAGRCGEYPGVYASLDDPALQEWIRGIIQRSPVVPPTLTDIRSFEHTSGDTSTENRLAQTALNLDGASLSTRYRPPGNSPWGAWGTPTSVRDLGLPDGSATIRSFGQGVNPAGLPKQDVVSADGATLLHRVFTGGAWQPWQSIGVGQLGLPETGPIRGFEVSGPDTAMGAATWKQTAISGDGKRLLYRFHRGGWEPWSTLPVAQIGISGVDTIRSFSQGVNPAGQAKQDVLSANGFWLYSRVFADGRWGGWQQSVVSALGVPEAPPDLH